MAKETEPRYERLMRSLLPKGTDVYVGQVPRKMFVPCPTEEVRDKVDNAYEIIMAESRYNPGFDLLPIPQSHIRRHPGIVEKLTWDTQHKKGTGRIKL